MEFRKISSRLEFFVLVLLLLSFFFLLTPQEERKALVTTFYINTGGTAPGGGTLLDPWPCFDYIDWSIVADGDVIVVAAGTYSPDNSITIQRNDIAFEADGVVYVNDDDFTADDPLIEINSGYDSDNCLFYGFNLYCDDATYDNQVVQMLGSFGNVINNARFENCYIKSDYEEAFYVIYSNGVTIQTCKIEQVVDTNYAMDSMYFEQCEDLMINKCEICTLTSQIRVDSLLKIINCTCCLLQRNKFFATGSASANYGAIFSTISAVVSDMFFENNVLYGCYRTSAIDDCGEFCNSNFNYNTINNTYDGGIGYRGERADPDNCLTSFRNNILYVSYTTTNSYPIYIGGTLGNWIPAVYDLDYNCYFTNGTNNYTGYWSGSLGYLTDWRNDTGFATNSVDVNPNFYNNWRMNTSSPASVMKGGCLIASGDEDIDGGVRDSIISANLGVSMGADQYSEAVFEPNLPGPLDFGSTSTDFVRQVSITNYGLSDFEITDIDLVYVSGGTMLYTIISGDIPAGASSILVNPGATHSIDIVFWASSGTSNTTYQARLEVEHNAFMNHGTVNTDNLPVTGYVP